MIVCFYNEKDKKVGCGRIKSTKAHIAILKVTDKTVKKLKPGMKAETKEERAEEPTKTAAHSMTFTAFTNFSPMTVASYNKIYYQPPTSGITPSTLWASSGTNSSLGALSNFGMSIEMNKYHLAAGFRYGLFTTSSQDANYGPTTNLYSTTEITGTSISVFADDTKVYSFKGIDFGVGIDIDESSVSLKMTEKDDTGQIADNDLYSLNSTIMIIGIRLPIRYNLSFGSHGLGLTFALVPILPLFGTAKGSPSISDPNATQVGDEASDLTSSLGLKKSSLGLDLTLGAFFSL